MIFETHNLKEPLTNYIESIFYYRGLVPDHSIERVVPTGHIFIIFELDGIPRHTFDNESLQPNGSYSKVWVAGMHKNYLSISAHQDSEMLVIQFKTEGAYPFLRIPLNELNNRVVPAQELFGEEILELREELMAENPATGKFNSVENWLLNRFDSNKITPDEIIDVLSLIRTEPVTESGRIIDSYPYSQKHLINRFKTYLGLTPKLLHRIFRFNGLLKQIQNEQHLNWAQIAYEFGYSDQSHFIKEFKEFSGFNPKEFIDSDYHKDETNFFPLDRDG